MSSLSDRLRRALDRDAPKGWWSLLRRSPADEGRLIAQGREAEALSATRALLASPKSPPRVRQNTIPLLAFLLPVVGARRKATEVIASGGYFAEVMAEMKQHLDDPDLEVRVLAAVEILRLATDTDLVELRPRLLPLLPHLRERREDSPMVRQAVVRLGGPRDVMAWLREIDATTGPLPPDVGELLDALDRGPAREAVPLLPGLFVRLDAIAEKRPPKQMTLGGIRMWDVDTLEAIKAFRLFLRGAGAEGVVATIDLMKAASGELMPVLLEESATEGEQAVRLFSAVVDDASLPTPLRKKALALLAAQSRGAGPDREQALAKLRRLREAGDFVDEVDRLLRQDKAARD